MRKGVVVNIKETYLWVSRIQDSDEGAVVVLKHVVVGSQIVNEDISGWVEQEYRRIEEVAVVDKHILHHNFGRWKYPQTYHIHKAWIRQHPILYAH